ncbi:hypothetical protein LUZ60_013999 [Juncus effusus]|nr:hypothetical protein LUZ60_013999 [Juncus effusus]
MVQLMNIQTSSWEERKKEKLTMLRTALRLKGKQRLCVLFPKSNHFSTDSQSGRLAGKIAVITGASSGIGKVAAHEFIKNGGKVILADIQDQLGESIAKDLGPNASFIHCDVTNESQVAGAVQLAVAKYGKLDIMYNNAGIVGTLIPTITDMDLNRFDQIMTVNVRSMVAGIKHAARVMIPRKAGSIICTASIGGMIGGLAPPDYSISKAAVLGLVKSASAELCQYGIRVNCVSPHAIPTPMGVNAMKKLFPGIETEKCVELHHKMGELEGAKCEESDIAKAALFLASDEAKYVSGHNLVVDGGFTAFKRLNFSGI